ncbi:hypothetical protein, partial [Citrobacter sp. A316]|uniref:hypothetical protein n=1 Tax=Citrobacter sp. A316 TaxID=1639132 RepID=UPI0009C99829
WVAAGSAIDVSKILNCFDISIFFHITRIKNSFNKKIHFPITDHISSTGGFPLLFLAGMIQQVNTYQLNPRL